MATTKLLLMFSTVEGYDGNLEITPSDGEKAFDLLVAGRKGLKAQECTARPQPMRGGSGGRPGGNKPAPATVAGASCPTCGGAVVERSGTGKNNKPYRLHHCQRECGWKEFLAA